MAQLDTGGGNGKGKKSKQKKMNARVDFTPMVDMIMLLVNFLHALYYAPQAPNDGNHHAFGQGRHQTGEQEPGADR